MARARHWDVRTAGISGEQYRVNIENQDEVEGVLIASSPSDVVCTVGINLPSTLGQDGIWGDLENDNEQMYTNALCPIRAANAWYTLNKGTDHTGHFVVISSNSAHIPRSGSLGYCMSKAALSMGIRCIARESARAGEKLAFYVYEPGWLAGTPMSQEVAQRLAENGVTDMHRIPSGQTIPAIPLAGMIVNNLSLNWNLMNGSCIRLDGGEL
jgi:NAD(P)-dependent dehydrogenase (short-subunit alcohol dehydrogenase family)